MCGIAGHVGATPPPENRINECLRRMQHRGPDASGMKSWRRRSGDCVSLLHTRLSIIDLDPRANQPFQDGGTFLIFNGEIYNYVEQRTHLESEGFRFRTQSDTEVLLASLSRKGIGALDQLEGMWAFALYDEADESLTLSRDRFGEKPLYLYRDSTGVYFGSEVKFISALRGKNLDPNVNQLYRYLVNGYKSLYKTGETFFKDLVEVPSATWLRIDRDGHETAGRYWEPRYEPDEAMSYSDAVNGARERLIEAVGIRLRADVPLAFCMSGGVDSNALIAVAKRHFSYDVHGFTITSGDGRYDEEETVLKSVSELKVRHTLIPADTRDFLPRLRSLVRDHDAPVATITYYAHWLIQQSIAANGYKISISGTGADELFSGYYDHHLAYLYEVRNDAALYEESLQAWTTHIKPVVRNPYLSRPKLFIEDRNFRGHIFLDADKFSGYLVNAWKEPFQEAVYSDSLLRNRMLNELRHESVPVILHEDDLNCMSFSIENRSPFLDRSLCDFSLRIPCRHLVRQGRAKAVLRDAMRGIVPDDVLDAPRKVGFNLPIETCLDMQDGGIRDQILSDSPIFDHVRREAIEKLLTKKDLPNSESKFLFYFLNARIFMEEFG